MGFLSHLFTDDFKEIKRAQEPMFRTPKSVQETIEIVSVTESGIFQVGKHHFSKCYSFGDINYATATYEEQRLILERYCRLLNSLTCQFKITINNKNQDMDCLAERVLFAQRSDGYDAQRQAYNDVIADKVAEGRQGIEQQRYLTITVERKDLEEAKAQFASIEANLQKSFALLGSSITPLSGDERLRVLYDFYHLGKEGSFDFNLRETKALGRDFKNDICNGKLSFYPQHFEDEDKFCRVLFIKRYPTALADSFFTELANLPVHLVASIDVAPIPKELTTHALQKKYLGIESDIIKQQQNRNRNNNFSSDISYAKRTQKRELESLMDDIRENDQCMYYVGVTLLVMAKSKEELDAICESIYALGMQAGVTIEPHYLKQREAMNTALPIGVRQVATMRTMTTGSLAALLPFNIQELGGESGIYYGINQVSRNVNIANRKALLNGNGFVFGVSGSGKSFFCKLEMGSVFLGGKDEVIVIDPMSEYFDVARAYGGSVINMAAHTDNFVNPLELDVYALDLEDSQGWVADKSQFMLGLCEQCMREDLRPAQRSIIDRCVRQLYFGMLDRNVRYVPVMEDFYQLLLAQPEPEAREIALSLELFVKGSLDVFNHPTTVDTSNRFTVYGIRDLGSDLAPIAMMVMLEAIQQRIVANGAAGRATWLYIDELHVLLGSEYCARYLQQLWKKVRKQGGLCTGITQNVVDLLQSYVATTMLNNSEFVALLKQSPKDAEEIVGAVNISAAQLPYVTETPQGTGLLKCGQVVVPFDVRVEEGSPLFELYRTGMVTGEEVEEEF